MTEKWIVDDCGTLINIETRENYDYMEEVVDVLNKLSKENEQLKIQLQNTSAQRDEFHHGARENANRVGKLKKENEQLKQLLKCSREEANEYCEELMSIEASIKLYEDINKNLKQAIKESYEILSTDVDVFSEKATEHDINAYIELRELDNKDAYYIAKGTKKAINLLKRWL